MDLIEGLLSVAVGGMLIPFAIYAAENRRYAPEIIFLATVNLIVATI